ncbi:hypothetical protein ZIOFF_015921 [Zingiber officinale]|uniref:Uncharacterized protein n=1 Tax=Zingiber officinale TaxID=94328 RepID=A0A8J5I109_ZINOF|nr:hypothetical protein ZIOFF_015921 [Zingiber officinale]
MLVMELPIMMELPIKSFQWDACAIRVAEDMKRKDLVGTMIRWLLTQRYFDFSDVYLVGTVMLVFGMGLYEIFISNLDIAKMSSHGSNLLGLFKLMDNGGGKQINHGISVQSNNGSFVVDICNSMFTCSNSSTKSMKVEGIPVDGNGWLTKSCLVLDLEEESGHKEFQPTPFHPIVEKSLLFKCPMSKFVLLFLCQASAVAKIVIAILLIQACHLAQARTLEAHAPMSTAYSSTILKDPCCMEFLKGSHGRYLLQNPSTSPGHSPGVGHSTPPLVDTDGDKAGSHL